MATRPALLFAVTTKPAAGHPGIQSLGVARKDVVSEGALSRHHSLCGDRPEAGSNEGAVLNDGERAKNDRMFVCVSRAISDRLVLDL